MLPPCRPTDQGFSCGQRPPRSQRHPDNDARILPSQLKAALAVSYDRLLGRVQRMAAWLSFLRKAASKPLAVQGLLTEEVARRGRLRRVSPSWHQAKGARPANDQ